MKSRYLVVLLFCASCADNGQPAAPSLPTPPTNAVTRLTAIASPSGCSPGGARIGEAQPDTRIGSSERSFLRLTESGPSVRIVFYAGPPDPQQDQVGFEGSRTGDTITAVRRDPAYAMTCGGRRLPEVGGSLAATLDGNRLVGDFTIVYGTGTEQVTMTYHFEATL